MVVVAFGILGVAQAAAADLPAVLRGPIVGELVPAHRWSGVYGGAQAGFSTASMNFNQNVGALVGDMLRLTTIEQDFKDRKSTRLNSSHEWTSYAVFCLKK